MRVVFVFKSKRERLKCRNGQRLSGYGLCFRAKQKAGTAQIGRDYQGMVCVSEQKRKLEQHKWVEIIGMVCVSEQKRKFEQQKWVEIIRVCFVFQSKRESWNSTNGQRLSGFGLCFRAKQKVGTAEMGRDYQFALCFRAKQSLNSRNGQRLSEFTLCFRTKQKV